MLTIVTDGPAFTPGEDPRRAGRGRRDRRRPRPCSSSRPTWPTPPSCARSTSGRSCRAPRRSPTPAWPSASTCFRVIATDPETEATQLEPTEYEWTVLLGADTTPPDTQIVTARRPTARSDTVFTFTGTDDQTQPLALTFECRLDSTLEADFVECISPFNLLEEFPELRPRRPHASRCGPSTTAIPTPQRRPDAGQLHAGPRSPTPRRRRRRSSPTPVTPTDRARRRVHLRRHRQRHARAAARRSSARSTAAPFEPCDSPASVQGLDAGAHTFAGARRRPGRQPRRARRPRSRGPWSARPTTTILTGPRRPEHQPGRHVHLHRRPGRLDLRVLVDGATFVPCTSPLALDGLTDGAHTFEVQATNTFGLVEDPPAEYTWTVAAGADTTRTRHHASRRRRPRSTLDADGDRSRSPRTRWAPPSSARSTAARVRGLQLAVRAVRPGRRRAHLRGARRRRRRQRRPHAGHRTPGPSTCRRSPRSRPARGGDRGHHGDVRVRRQRARRQLRVLARRRSPRRAPRPVTYTGLGARRAHLRRAGHRRHAERGLGLRGPRVDDRRPGGAADR